MDYTVANSDLKINQPSNVAIEQFNEQQQAFYDQVYKEMDLKHQGFQLLFDKLFNYKEKIISGLDKILQLIIDQIKMLKDSMIKMSSIIQSDCNKETMIKNIQETIHKQQLRNMDVKDQVGNQLKSFQLQFADIDEFSKILNNQSMKNEENVLLNTNIQIFEALKDNAKQFQKLQYYLIEESTVKLEENFYSFAFNNDNTVLLVGCEGYIIVYEFMNGKIVKELQKLTGHFRDVACLYFMKRSNSFVSLDYDSQIIIWIINQNNRWIAQEVLKENGSAFCMTMNKMEDQLISSSFNSTLKFWKLMTGGWTYQQSLEMKNEVRSMSFNETEDKLIVCETNDYSNTQKSSIQVLKQSKNKQWSIVQTLGFDGWGFRLCFTIGNQFVFTTQNSDLLKIYDCDNQKQQYKQVALLQIQKIKECCSEFACQYIKPLNILTFKHGEYLNIIKANENYKYELIQYINFGTSQIYGRVSDNGQYIVTWSSSSKELQIRKIQNLD